MSTQSESRSSSEKLDSTIYKIPRELAAFGTLPVDIQTFIRFYLASSPIPETLLSPLLRHLSTSSGIDNDDHNDTAGQIFVSTFSKEFPLKRSYEILLLKKIIEKLEKGGSTPPDCLYEKLCDLLRTNSSNFTNGDFVDSLRRTNSSDGNFYRIFLNFCRLDFVVICENVEQIGGGTTGLSCWQAACVLAEFFHCGIIEQLFRQKMSTTKKQEKQLVNSNHDRLSLLELGAGCGLTGIATAKFFPNVVSRLALTDHHSDVLQRLCRNVALNFGGSLNGNASGQHISVHKLDWLDYRLDELQITPFDVIFASDIIYDPELIPSFCSLLSDLLTSLFFATSSPAAPLAFVACTVRNIETIDLFRMQLSKNQLCVIREFLCPVGENRFEANGETIYRFEPLFPPSSKLLLPVLIFEISATRDSESQLAHKPLAYSSIVPSLVET